MLALCLTSSERLYLLREELCTLCEGGDVELGARTSKHILVFAFDLLSLTLSLLYCALHHFILFIHTYMLGIVCLCAILVLNQESFI